MTKSIINDINLIYEGIEPIEENYPLAPRASNYQPGAVVAARSAPQETTDEILADIARDVLGIKTLTDRKMDDLDFYEVHVSNLKDALSQAFQAGKLSR